MTTLAGTAGRACVIAVLVVSATSVAAWAKTGSIAYPRSVEFYYGETSGNGDSQDFSGDGRVRMCTNSDGGSNNTYNAQYRRNRTLQPDVIIREANVSYSEGKYESSYFRIYPSHQYHTRAGWSAVPSAPNDYEGHVLTRYEGGACNN